MKNEWTNKLFRPKGGLTRGDIKSYGATTDERVKHSIEEKSLGSDFESDALEGWSDLNYDVGAMKRLDKRFLGAGSFGYLIAVLSTALVITVAFYTYNWLSGPQKPIDKTPIAEKVISKTTPEIILDESDVVIPKEIEDMVEAPEQEQIHAEVIKEDFKEIQQNTDEGVKIKIKELPVLEPHELPQEQPTELERVHFSAKEIYLSDLKLIDYREYRSKPIVRTKQMVLTGLPANKETEQSDDLDPEWTDTEIPYIEYIEKSMRIFSKGNYKRALTRFQTILETYDDDVNALFYGGLCLYNLKEYNEAIVLFKSCVKGSYSNFDEEAQWMIALSAEKSGNKKLADKYFRLIIEQNGFYSSQAREKLK